MQPITTNQLNKLTNTLLTNKQTERKTYEINKYTENQIN